MPLETAVAWLAVRPGSCEAEVRQAFRQRVRELRPDLAGRVSGSAMADLDGAREALVAAAGPDRRRTARKPGEDPAAVLRRRATWGLDDAEPPSVDVDL